MFIRRRVLPGPRQTVNYQLLESAREGDRVKQHLIVNLGSHPTISGALVAAYKAVADLRAAIVRGLTINRENGVAVRRLTKREKNVLIRQLHKEKERVKALEPRLESVVSNRHDVYGEFDTTY